MRTVSVVFAIVLGLSSFPILVASLVELMNSVPAPPTRVGEALAWKRGGDYINPAYLALTAMPQAAPGTMNRLRHGRSPHPPLAFASGPPSPASGRG